MADIRINALATTATSAASDDYLALDGSANGTRKILATNVAQNVTDVTFGVSGPSAKSSINARAARQGLVFDGTAGATVASVPAFGTSDFTLVAWIKVPSSVTGSNRYLTGGTGSNAPGWFINTSGVLRVVKTDVGDTTGTSTTALTPNAYALVAYTKASGVSTHYLNGVADGTGTDSANYTSAIAQIGSQAGALFFGGSIVGPYIYNRALTAAEVVALYEAGVPAGADYGVAAGVFNTNNSPAGYFDNGATGTFTSTSATGGTIAYTGGANVTYRPAFVWYSNRAQQAGQYIKVTYTTQVTSGSPVLFDRGFMLNGGFSTLVSGTAPTVESAFSGTQNWSYVVQITSTGTNHNQITFDGTANSKASWGLVISNIAITPLGLLLAPDAGQAGNGYVWNDVSGNVAQITLPSSGVGWNVPSIAGNRIRGTTNTNGNQQLFGASVLLPAESQILHVRARSRSGTPSITIGTASGGAQIVASVALSTTWQNLTIALTGGIVSSADDIWIGSNSTDVVETDISWQPLDF